MLKKSIKLGFIGAGWWATSNHIPTAKKRKEVILDSVCRLGKNDLLKIKNNFGFQFATEDYKELLKRDLNGVIISTPHSLHFKHSKEALEKNINVLIEKPMSIKTSEAECLVKIAKQKNLKILISHGWHYLKESRLAKEKIMSGYIGKIESIVCNQSSGVRELLQGTQWDIKGKEIMFNPEPSTWSDPNIAKGGYGLAQMTHSIALVCFIANINPISVFCIDSSNNIELHKTISVKCEDNLFATFTGSSTHLNTYDNCQITIFGEQGTLILNIGRNINLEIYKKDTKKFTYTKRKDKLKLFGPTSNFIDMLINPNSTNWSDGELGLKTTLILDASYKSSKSSKLEKVDRLS